MGRSARPTLTILITSLLFAEVDAGDGEHSAVAAIEHGDVDWGLASLGQVLVEGGAGEDAVRALVGDSLNLQRDGEHGLDEDDVGRPALFDALDRERDLDHFAGAVEERRLVRGFGRRDIGDHEGEECNEGAHGVSLSRYPFAPEVTE